MSSLDLCVAIPPCNINTNGQVFAYSSTRLVMSSACTLQLWIYKTMNKNLFNKGHNSDRVVGPFYDAVAKYEDIKDESSL